MLQIQWPTCIEIADRLGSDYAIIILSPQEVGSIFDVNFFGIIDESGYIFDVKKHSEGIFFRLVHEPDAESKRLRKHWQN